MGVIKRQSILSTTYTYMGVVLGFITTALLFSKYLTPSENGLLKLLVSYSTIFAQFANLGINAVAIRFFPFFRNEDKKNHGLLFLLFSVLLVGFILFLVVFLILSPKLIQSNKADSPLFVDYLYFIIPLTFFTLLFGSLDVFYRGLFKSTVGAFLKEFAQRTFIFVFILLYIFEIINFHWFVIFYCVALSLPTVILLILLIKDKHFHLKPDFSIIDKPMARQMVQVAFFGLITGFGNIAILNIDSIMVNEYTNTALTGIYAITSYFGILVSIPSRAFLRIGSTVIAQAHKENDLKTIDEVYKKSCLNQFIIGLLLFLGLIVNLENIFQILPPDYAAGKYVIIFIGLSHLSVMATGANTIIIGSSKFYKANAYAVMALLALTVITNIIFIPRYGISGAAFASVLSMCLFNVIEYIVIYIKFSLQPYNYKFILVSIFGVATYGIMYYVPSLANLYLNIAWLSTLTTILFMGPVLLLKISPDINALFAKGISMLKSR